ncbi:MAG TPA: GNAT family N-acetyltransferase [Roseomonas sp.]
MAEADFEPLLDLSIRVLRDDLVRLGRFDPERRRHRMRDGFDPAAMRAIEAPDGRLLGCIAVAAAADHVELHGFYLEPAAQGRGLGAAVLAAVRAGLPALPIRIEVLRGSRARRFWEGQGFRFVEAQDFDDVLEHPGGR